MQEYSTFLPAFTPYTLHPRGHTIPCNTLVIPLPLRYHSDTTLNLYRRNSERTPKEERSVVVPLWLRTPKEERSLMNYKLPLRKGSARVAIMKVSQRIILNYLRNSMPNQFRFYRLLNLMLLLDENYFY